MKTINYFEIVCKTYHVTPVQRLLYSIDNEIVESQLYTPKEITNIVAS